MRRKARPDWWSKSIPVRARAGDMSANLISGIWKIASMASFFFLGFFSASLYWGIATIFIVFVLPML